MKATTLKIRKRRNDEGVALFLVVGLLFVLTALSAAFIQNVHGALDAHRRDRHRMVTQALAEAGIHKAAAELMSDPSGYTGEPETALGGGFFSVTVSPGAVAGEYRVRATGKLADGDYVLHQSVLTARVVVDGDRVRITPLPTASAEGGS